METYQDRLWLSKRKYVGADTSWKWLSTKRQMNAWLLTPQPSWVLRISWQQCETFPSFTRTEEISRWCRACIMGTQWKHTEGHIVLQHGWRATCSSNPLPAWFPLRGDLCQENPEYPYKPSSFHPLLLPDYRRDKVSLRDYLFLLLTLPRPCSECASPKTEGLAITREANCWRSPNRHSPAAH